jgi:hypothetical protein
MLYGTKNGRIGLVDLKQSFGTILWEIGSSSSSAVSAMHCHPITNNASPDLLVAKEDGLIEIFAIDELDNASFRQSYVSFLFSLFNLFNVFRIATSQLRQWNVSTSQTSNTMKFLLVLTLVGYLACQLSH